MDQYHFHWLAADAGFRDEKELAKFFEVTEKTVRNWKRQCPPKAVQSCLELMSGRLDCLGKPWRGFRLTPEAIESPDGDFIYAHEVRAIGYVYQAAGIERARLCTMLKNTTPIQRRDRRLKNNETNTRVSKEKRHST